MVRYGMAINLNHCIGCQTCVVACQQHNALRVGSSRNSVDALEWGRWPDADRCYLPHSCLHCDIPRCVDVCPTGASKQAQNGIVSIDHDLCIGCGVCITACEFGGRSLNSNTGHYFGASQPAPYEVDASSDTSFIEKCDLCSQRLAQDEEPACVVNCLTGIRMVGDLDDEGSEINEFIKEHACVNIPGTAMFYGIGARDFDVGRLIAESSFVSARAARAAETVAPTEVDVAVVGSAGVAAAALSIGVGISTKRARAKRKEARYKGGMRTKRVTMCGNAPDDEMNDGVG